MWHENLSANTAGSYKFSKKKGLRIAGNTRCTHKVHRQGKYD